MVPNEWKELPRPERSACAEIGNERHDGKFEVSSTHSEGEIMAILNVGIDLAKNVFALHGVNEFDQVDLGRPSVPRTKLHALVAALPPCTIGMEACSGEQ